MATIDSIDYRRQAKGVVPLVMLSAILIAGGKVSAPAFPLILIALCGVLCAISTSTGQFAVDLSRWKNDSAGKLLRWRKSCRVAGSVTLGAAIILGSLSFVVSGVRSLNTELQPSPIVSVQMAAFVALEALAWALFWVKPGRTLIGSFGLTCLSLSLIWFLSSYGGLFSGLAIGHAVMLRSLLACAVLYRCARRAGSEEESAHPAAPSVARVLAWKEFREQYPAWLAMASIFAISFVGARYLFLSGGAALLGAALAIGGALVPAVYGLVCAGMLLAGEYENRTMPYLDAMLRTRTEVWVIKCVLGAGFTVALAAFAALVALAPYSDVTTEVTTDSFAVLAAFFLPALTAFAFGMLAAALCRTALGATALGAVIVGPLYAAVGGYAYAAMKSPGNAFGIWGGVVLLALYGSWRSFCRRDLGRSAAPSVDASQQGNSQGPLPTFHVSERLAFVVGAGLGSGLLPILWVVVIPSVLSPWTQGDILSGIAAVLWGVAGVTFLWRCFIALSSPQLAAYRTALAAALLAIVFWLFLAVLAIGNAIWLVLPATAQVGIEVAPSFATLFACWWFVSRGTRLRVRRLAPSERAAAA